jgi:hypothetical protein
MLLEFSRKTIVGSVNIQKDLTEGDIETIIVNGFEGGIHYWAGVDNTGELWDNKPDDVALSQWATKLVLEGHGVKLYDVEEEEDDDNWVLTLDNILEGYRLNFQKRKFDNDIENGDATTYDCIIQYALFGELVFG